MHIKIKIYIFTNVISDKLNEVDMASISQLVSEIANAIQQPDNIIVRRSIALAIVQSRNTLLRRRYSNHSFIDDVVRQRIRMAIIDVHDGDVLGSVPANKRTIKRTKFKINRPVTFINNLPFHSVRTVGSKFNKEVAYTKEASSPYYSHIPGMNMVSTYSYINGYLYITFNECDDIKEMDYIIVEGVFEKPQIIEVETHEGVTPLEEDEFLLPEDMVIDVKKMVLEIILPQIVKQNDEIPNTNLMK